MNRAITTLAISLALLIVTTTAAARRSIREVDNDD
jgi:hypothetical protein